MIAYARLTSLGISFLCVQIHMVFDFVKRNMGLLNLIHPSMIFSFSNYAIFSLKISYIIYSRFDGISS